MRLLSIRTNHDGRGFLEEESHRRRPRKSTKRFPATSAAVERSSESGLPFCERRPKWEEADEHRSREWNQPAHGAEDARVRHSLSHLMCRSCERPAKSQSSIR